MSDDIVTRLRALRTRERPIPDLYYVSPDEAADEIERLRKQNELLGKALRQNGITEVRIQPEKWKEMRDDE